MKPLKLYTRTTILVSLILISVLLAVVYFFITRATEIEAQEQRENGRILVLRLANSLPELSPDLEKREIIKNIRDFRTLNATAQLQVIRVYDKSLNEIVQYPTAAPADIPQQVLSKLAQKDATAIFREGNIKSRNQDYIDAYAPMLADDGKMAGVVSLTLKREPLSGLSQRLIILTIALLAVAIVSIISVLYILFSQVIYRPLDDLVKTMAKAEKGDLEVVAPVRANDEFGQLATGFNQMISRLRAMTSENAKYQKQLEERVFEATSELAERNSQLEDASATLFEIQRELTKFERLAAAGQLAAQFAHEVGTPLNLISGHVQLLMVRSQDEKTHERLNLIASQIARIEKIVRGMLDATRRPRLTLIPTDLNVFLQRIFEITAPTLAARNVTLVTELDEANPEVMGDNEQLQQVFINLINNSLDAMPDGGELFFSTSVLNDVAIITCRDTGIGISAEVRERIFDPLFTTKLNGRGSGLGLTVVHKIIQEHGGQITLKSEAGQGAEFQISLPLTESSRVKRPLSLVMSE
ncbi:MAG: HAMP domain-containing protein [Acidobacteria bacterium]|nr:HAMP domain-containing protein [Acidobacteriota bacterium]